METELLQLHQEIKGVDADENGDDNIELQEDIAQKIVAVRSGREQLEFVKEELENIEAIQEEISIWSADVLHSNEQRKSGEVKVWDT